MGGYGLLIRRSLVRAQLGEPNTKAQFIKTGLFTVSSETHIMMQSHPSSNFLFGWNPAIDGESFKQEGRNPFCFRATRRATLDVSSCVLKHRYKRSHWMCLVPYKKNNDNDRRCFICEDALRRCSSAQHDIHDLHRVNHCVGREGYNFCWQYYWWQNSHSFCLYQKVSSWQ